MADKIVYSAPAVTRLKKNNYKISLSGESIAVGDTDTKFIPRIKLNRWDGEVSTDISLAGIAGDNDAELVDGKVSWRNNLGSVRIYGLDDIAAGTELGGIEFEIVLNKIPPTNKFSFDIVNRGLEWFYQPPLNAQEISIGAIRPENVVGSYAVYHTSKKNHILGQTNYAAGKAFHLFRPQVTDALGNSIWGEFNQDVQTTGVLTITVDRKWLDAASYPVVIDPTFGKTTIGGTSGQWLPNYIRRHGDSYLGAAGTGTSMSIYARQAAVAKNIQMGVYNTASPNARIGNTGSVLINSTAQWWTAAFTVGGTLSAIAYRLCWNGNAAADYPWIYWDVTGTLNEKHLVQTFGTWPATIAEASWVDGGLRYQFSIYVTYTVDYAGTTVVTTQNPDPIAATTATGNGAVFSLATAPTSTQHGHVWTTVNSTARPNLTADAATKTSLGVPIVGAFTSSLTGLTAGKKYYIRSYVTNSLGSTTYGPTIPFTTLSTTAPTITTQACTSVTSSNAVGNGNLVSAGGYTISERGHAWSIHHLSDIRTLPTVTYAIATTAGGTLGAYTSAITPLLVNTVYFVRAYCKTSTGLYFYGAEVELVTSGGLPIVTTQLTKTITNTTATGNLTLVNNGGSLITQYGVCWKTSTNPTISDSKTEEGAYSTVFPKAMTSAISGLLSNTLYYLKAYATNSTGTAYGAEVTFTTKIGGAPTVTTEPTTITAPTTAIGNGTIQDIGSSAVTEQGHVIGTSPHPIITGTKFVSSDGDGSLNKFISLITSLSAGTTYYTRAYATNTQGTAYGDNDEFTFTGSAFPTTATTRVTSLIHRYNRLEGIYELVEGLGGVTLEFGLPTPDFISRTASLLKQQRETEANSAAVAKQVIDEQTQPSEFKLEGVSLKQMPLQIVTGASGGFTPTKPIKAGSSPIELGFLSEKARLVLSSPEAQKRLAEALQKAKDLREGK